MVIPTASQITNAFEPTSLRELTQHQSLLRQPKLEGCVALEHKLAAEKTLGEAARSIAFHASQAQEREKYVGLKPALGTLGFECLNDDLHFLLAQFNWKGYKNVRLPQITVVFGNLVFQNQMIPKGVPS